jgi:hypothetical protein
MQVTVYGYVNDTGGLQKTDTDTATGQSNSFMEPFYANFNSAYVTTLDKFYDITAGHWTSADGTQTISWPKINAFSWPNTTSGRAAHRIAAGK